MKRIVIGIIIGAIPRVVLILLTIPISGEIELTLGVGGIFLTIVGIVVGAIIASQKC